MNRAPAKVYSLTTSYLICMVAYVCALVAAYLFLQIVPDKKSLLMLFVADVIATVVVFMFSLAFKNSSIYDPYWSVIPPFLLLQRFSVYQVMNTEMVTALALVICLWAVRLTYNWAKGWQGLAHEDWRYKMLREKNPKLYPVTNFFGIHLFPTVMVFLGMLPVLTIATGCCFHPIVFYAGAGISIIAVVIEFAADEQMRAFKKTAKQGEFIQQGLWKYSRHPNYFGEILFWFGLWVMAVANVLFFAWTGIGWLAMLLMFVFASIPMMEEKNRKSKPGYEAYISSVSMLIPWFPKRNN